MKKYFLVTDFGSSSVRSLLLGSEGKIEAISKKELNPSYEGDRVEYDAAKLIEACKSALEAALREAGDGEIISFGVACQRSTFVIWDKITGVPLTPVISWQDGRARELVARLKISNSEIHSLTGLYKTPYYSAPKIKFCAENEEKVARAFAERRAAVGSVATYALWNLSGGKLFVIDPTLAQRTLLFNIKKMKWEPRLLELFGVPAAALPEVVPTFQKKLKINFGGRELPLGGIIGDQQAAVMAFTAEKGKAAVNYGTGAFLLAGTGREIIRIRGLLNSVAFTDEKNNYYLLESTVNSCGTFLQWLNLKFNLNLRIEDLEPLIKKSGTRLFVLPSIGGIGSPYWDYDTLTTFSGFTPAAGINDLIRSSVEGIAFFIADGLEKIKKKLPVSSLVASGGLSHLDYLLRFQGDITGLEVRRFRDPEATALGLGRALALQSGCPVEEWKAFETDRKYLPVMSAEERTAVFGEWKYFFDGMRKLYRGRKQVREKSSK
ncbi:MAG: hypothetical protein COT17_00515 [Elusimicrobia bacterium CG08_land_8_20_14_0_20_51_18]|nr:MAG: hypothetical protein COT17_00515 [Elusimicrobia bacterium CG08_land_8_20_14_0_20_51_18]